MNVRCARQVVLVLLSLLPLAAAAQEPAGIDVRMPLVEQALAFVRSRAIQPLPEARLLRAGAIRVCGEDLSASGCGAPGAKAPAPGDESPAAAMAWRRILESALAAEAIRKGEGFDRGAFQRWVVDAMVAELDDPASFYITPSVYRRITSIPSGFTGFGLIVVPERDCLRVAVVHAGSPAADAGLHGGERIVAVNGAPVTGFHRPPALAAVWGAAGEHLELVFVRGAKPAAKARLVYRPWRFRPYDVTHRGEIVEVRIRTFAPGLAQAVGRELAGATGLVIDLRAAVGGQEQEMIALADILLGEASIGSRVMRDELGNQTWSAEPGSAGERVDVKLAIVTGSGTSGLAEVFAAAMRHRSRAILVGRKTAGRSTLETIRAFDDDSAIQLTTTRLLGPSETTLEDGVLPHLATDRIGVADLAARILERATGPSLDELIAAARDAVAER